jgi:hypothetical protein
MLPLSSLKDLASILIGLLDAVKVSNPILFYVIQGIMWVAFLSVQFDYLSVSLEVKNYILVVLGLLISSVAPRTTYLKQKLKTRNDKPQL